MDTADIIYILVIHFLADACLQTHHQAMNKSTDSKALLRHVATYSGVWLLAAPIYLGWLGAAIFASITFIAHFFTDYITSRISKPLFEEKNYHDGFVVVLADQLIHYVQLFYTFKFLYERF